MRNVSESEQELHEDLATLRELLLTLGRSQPLRDPIARSFEELQLTPPQVHALMWLGHDGDLTMGELARRSGVTVKTLTGVVDRLEGAGHVKRLRDPKDRRIVRVTLTAKGARLFKKMTADMQERTLRFFRLIGPEDRKLMLGFLTRMVARLAHARAAAGRP